MWSLSNSIFFAYIARALVKNPFEKKHNDFHRAQKALERYVYGRLGSKGLFPNDVLSGALPFLDLEYFILPVMSLEKLIYLQESYWYYLEFQLNMILAIVSFDAAAAIWWRVYSSVLQVDYSIPVFVGALITGLSATIVLVSFVAARKNYWAHRTMLFSLVLGTLSAEDESKERKVVKESRNSLPKLPRNKKR